MELHYLLPTSSPFCLGLMLALKAEKLWQRDATLEEESIILLPVLMKLNRYLGSTLGFSRHYWTDSSTAHITGRQAAAACFQLTTTEAETCLTQTI